MTPALVLANLAAYSAQFGVLFLCVALAVRLLRPLSPRAELHVWEGVFLLACLLPVLSVWQVVSLGDQVSVAWHAVVTSSAIPAGEGRSGPWMFTLAVCAVCVSVARLASVAMGLARIRRWRRESRDCSDTGAAHGVEVRISDAIEAPVTIGLFEPVVLVPERFIGLPGAVQRAVIQHEAQHVRRRDPLRILIVEVWRACVWFHPAARALASRMELARELTLDRDAIAALGDRRAYGQALLAFTASASVAPAAAFTHRSHLARRIEAISHGEVPMSVTRRAFALAACAVVGLTASLGATAFVPMRDRLPNQAAGEPFKPGSGVELPRVLHEVKPEYTAEALQAKVQGAVFLDIVVEADGSVGRIVVSQSLDTVYGLDDAAVDAAEQWRFEPGRKDGAAVPVQVTLEMRFTLK